MSIPYHKFRVHIIVLTVVALIVLAVLLLVFRAPKKTDTKTVSPDVLSLTQPVMFMDGRVENVSNAALTVRYIPGGRNTNPNAAAKPLIYTVHITPSTHITYKPERALAILPANIPLPTVTANKITSGQKVLIESPTDLRLLKTPEFKALSISVEPDQTVVIGKILSLTDKTVTIQPMANNPFNPPGDKTYERSISTDVKFFELTPPQRGMRPQATSISKEQFSQGTDVFAISDKSIRSTDATIVTLIKTIPIVRATPPPLPL